MEEEKTTPQGKRDGIPLRTLNILMIVIACVLALLLMYTTWRASGGYIVTRDATDQYIDSQRSASEMQAGSDYLTEQVRAFAVTGNREALDRYFEEAEVTRRRDRALEELGAFFSGTEAYRFLEDALARSNELMEIEYRSMRLTIEANNYDLTDFPAVLSVVVLTPEEQAISPEEKSALAVDLVFGPEYQSYKDDISVNVAGCLDTLISETQQRQVQSSENLQVMLKVQAALIIVLLVVIILAVALTMRLVFQPLKQLVGHIQREETSPSLGSYEIRFVTSAYNKMLAQSQKHREHLSYEATHDPLTGLFNRGVFEQKLAEDGFEDIAFLLVDVDKFKQVNDSFGHDIGDRVLKWVASLLKASFRSEDCVCRLGGDEFAVIMQHADPTLRGLVERKLEHLNETLAAPKDDLPAVSLSVGVAFGGSEDLLNDVYRRADEALYRVKENGRRGFAFYES